MEKRSLEKGKVSIVIPVYNVEAYIRECLDSVLTQIYQKIEVIIIDDGSTDQSGEICDQYALQEDRILVVHNKNRGVSVARNTGIDLATGEYILFVDSDDQIHPRLLEDCLASIEGTANVMWDQTSEHEVWEQLQPGQGSVEVVGREHFMRLYYEDYMNPPFNKLFRTETIRTHGLQFPEKMSLGEDLLFNLRYLQAAGGDYKILHFPYYYYRENRTGSLSNSRRRDLLQVQKDCFGGMKEFLQRTEIWTEENAQIFYGIYWDRLFLTWKLVKELDHSILKDPIWQEIWRECGKRGLCTWKRRLKRWIIKIEKIRYGFR